MKGRAAGFSLIEVVMALAIFAVVAVALIGILGTGINLSQDALSDAETTMMMENIQARLTLDPAWPGSTDSLFYDNSGAQVNTENDGVFRVTLETVPGTGFSSAYLDTFRVQVERLPHRQKLGTWTLQRVRLARGKPQKAQL